MEEIDWTLRQEPAMRDRIVAKYYGFAVGLAYRKIAKLPANADRESMVSSALVGLLHAIDSFDGGIKAKFTTYATRRIRGAMLDSLRTDDHLSRKDRKLAKQRVEVTQRLMQSLQRHPTPEEIMAETEWSAQQYRFSLPTQPVSLEVPGVRIPPKKLHMMLHIEHSDRFREFTRGIDMDGQTLLYLYYYKNATMKVIGSALGVSESRVSQMHAQLLADFQAYGKERFQA